MPFRSKNTFPVLFLCLLFIGLGLSIDVSGDFALNDDWGYSTPVRWLIENGVTELTFWQSMPLLPQIGAGAAWSAVFGFDLETLRYLTMCFSAVSVLSVFTLARLAGVRAGLAFIVSLLPLGSPIFAMLSVTFMTDVPGLASLLLATCVFAASYRLEGRAAQNTYLVGALLCVLAVLFRQTNLGLPIALVIADLFHSRGQLRPALRAFLVLLASLASVAMADNMLAFYDAVPAAYYEKSDAVSAVLADLASFKLGVVKLPIASVLHFIAYAGLFMLPLLPLFWLYRPRQRQVLFGVSIVVASSVLVMASKVLSVRAIDGTTGDTWTSNGAGPHLIAGQYETGVGLPWIMTFLSCIVVLMALTTVFTHQKDAAANWKSSPHRSVIVLVLGTGLISYAPHALAYAALFDRYTLTPAIFLSIAIAALIPKSFPLLTIRLSYVIAACGVAFSTVLVQDHFAWQRARYALIQELIVDQTIAPDDIDGGFEYNNLRGVLSDFTHSDQGKLVDASGRAIVLTASKEPTAQILTRTIVPQLLGFSSLEIFALRRDTP